MLATYSAMIPSGSPKKTIVSTKPTSISNMTPVPAIFLHFYQVAVQQNN